MDRLANQQSGVPFGVLRSLAAPKALPEQCEFCAVQVPAEHRHLLEVSSRKILCVCDACGLRFQGVVGGRFEYIPREVYILVDFRLSDAQWEGLALPINLAFFVRSRANGKMTALYPSPAGVTESLLALEQWEAIAAENPALRELAPEVEAVLVNRVGTEREYFIAPIDRCYALAGLIRLNWRGLSGGEGVWRKIREFFIALRAEAVPASEPREVCRA
jgi:hypothetical protein